MADDPRDLGLFHRLLVAMGREKRYPVRRLGRLEALWDAYWSFIQWAKAEGCESIDFGGSATHFPPRETDAGYGVYRFKSGFGSELRYWMPYHDLVLRPRLYQLLRGAEARILPKAWQLRACLNH
jgi:FemAB family